MQKKKKSFSELEYIANQVKSKLILELYSTTYSCLIFSNMEETWPQDLRQVA